MHRSTLPQTLPMKTPNPENHHYTCLALAHLFKCLLKLSFLENTVPGLTHLALPHV